jgi:hypothetical protein
MQPKTPKLLEDVRDAAAFIRDSVRGKTLDDYHGERLLRHAIERNFEIIGEAFKRIAQHDPDPSSKSVPGAARRLVTFLARPRKVTKGRPPRCRAHCSVGDRVLPASMWRLRNSTWQGAQNAPYHGTRTVLVDFPTSSRAARRATRGSKQRQQKQNKKQSN